MVAMLDCHGVIPGSRLALRDSKSVINASAETAAAASGGSVPRAARRETTPSASLRLAGEKHRLSFALLSLFRGCTGTARRLDRRPRPEL